MSQQEDADSPFDFFSYYNVTLLQGFYCKQLIGVLVFSENNLKTKE